MVSQQLAGRDVRDARVLEAVEAIPREVFVPEGLSEFAYADRPLAIGCGQTISQPYMVAKVAELCRLPQGGTCLEIGSGCGYLAAVLSKLARRVDGVEWYESLAQQARTTVQMLGIENAFFHVGDGKLGFAPEAPYDAIVVSCAAREVPVAWREQLKPGGRLVFPLEVAGEQTLMCYTKGSVDWKEKETLFPVRYVPLL